MSILLLSRTAVLFTFFLVQNAGTDEWRGWRGLECQGVSSSPTASEWSGDKNVLWKTPIPGEGFSSPVINSKYVFVTAADTEDAGQNKDLLILFFLALSALALITISVISTFRELSPAGGVTKLSYISGCSSLAVSGLLVFGFCTILWMHFEEKDVHQVLINYLFSGAMVLVCILLFIKTIRSYTLRLSGGMIILILIYMLMRFRPEPDYFIPDEFLSPRNLWLIPLTTLTCILPALLSLYLITSPLFSRIKKNITTRNKPISTPGACIKRAFIAALIMGTAGFFVVPVISALKYFLLSYNTLRVQPALTLSLFLDPEYAFPVFPGIICIVYLLWFFTGSETSGRNKKTQAVTSSFLIIISAGFFLILNCAGNGPEYKRMVYCFDRYSGRVVWVRECLRGPAINISHYNSQATPTPLLDDTNIYSYFGSAGLISLDHNGRSVWERRDLPFESIHGPGSSPVMYQDRIILLNSMSDGPFLECIDKKTGHTQWRTSFPAFPGNAGEYRSPLIFHHDELSYIVEWSFIKRELVMYDFLTGQAAYRYPVSDNVSGEAVSTPVISGDTIILPCIENVTAVDLGRLIKGLNPVLWQAELHSMGPQTASLVMSGGLIFMVSDNGVATCLDSGTGRILWQERFRGAFMSSPVIAGGRVYFTNNAGTTTVVECSPQYRLVSRNDLREGIYSTLAFCGKDLFIRTKSALWCIKGPGNDE